MAVTAGSMGVTFMFFLLVIVGEFNAGKSAFINALLREEVDADQIDREGEIPLAVIQRLQERPAARGIRLPRRSIPAAKTQRSPGSFR